MRIDSINYIKNMPISKERVKNNSNIEKRDDYNISSLSKEYAIALRESRNSQDIREEKVQYISEQIKNESYFISSAQIASKILGEI